MARSIRETLSPRRGGIAQPSGGGGQQPSGQPRRRSIRETLGGGRQASPTPTPGAPVSVQRPQVGAVSPRAQEVYERRATPTPNVRPAPTTLREAFAPLRDVRGQQAERGFFVGNRHQLDELPAKEREDYPQGPKSPIVAGAEAAGQSLINLFSVPAAATESALGSLAQAQGRPLAAGVQPSEAKGEQQRRAFERLFPERVERRAEWRQTVERVVRSGIAGLLEAAASRDGLDPTTPGGTTVGDVIAFAALTPPNAVGEPPPEFEQKQRKLADDVNAYVADQAQLIREPTITARSTPAAHALSAIIAADEERGLDTTGYRETLVAMMDGDEEAAARLMTIAGDYRKLATDDIRDIFSPQAMAAARFTYARADRITQARALIDAGQPINEVVQQVENDLTTHERNTDMVLQMVVDPLNALDFVPIPFVNKILDIGGGGAGRAARWAGERLRQLAPFTDELATVIDDIPIWGAKRPSALRRALGPLLEPTQGSAFQSLSGELFDLHVGMSDALRNSPEARAVLSQAGINDPPALVALRAIADESYFDEIADALNTTPDAVRQRLGLGADLVNGQVVDITRSEPFVRQRYALQNADLPKLAAEFQTAQDKIVDVLRQPRVVPSLFEREGLRFRVTPEAREAVDALKRGDRPALFEALRAPSARAADDMAESLETVYRTLEQQYFQTFNVERAKVGRLTRIAQDVQSVYATIFHMGLNPGWLIRNKATDTVLLMREGVDILTPLTSVTANLERWGITPRSLFREFTGRVDVGPVKGLGGVNLFSAQRKLEQSSGFRAIHTGIERSFNWGWRPGRAIDNEAYRTLRASMANGRDADLVLARLQRARTLGDLEDIKRAFGTEFDAWRAIDDPVLAEALSKSPIQYDVDLILSESADVDEAITRIEAVAEDMKTRARDFNIGQAQAGGLEAYESEQVELMARAIGADEQGARFLASNFEEILAQGRSAVDESKAAMMSAIQANHPGSAEFKNAALELYQRADEALLAARDFHDEARIAWFSDGWANPSTPELQALYQGATSRSHAFFRYRVGVSQSYQEAAREISQEMLDLAVRAGANPAALPDLDELFQLHRQMMDGIDTIARTEHAMVQLRPEDTTFTRWKWELWGVMRKYGDGDLAAEVRALPDRQSRRAWGEVTEAMSAGEHEELLRALERRRLELPYGEQAVGDFVTLEDDVDPDLVRAADAVAEPDLTPQFDMRASKMADAYDADSLINDTVSHLEGKRGAISRLDPEEARAVREFVDAHRSRLTAMRDIAGQVGTQTRDFVIHNYEDRAKIDQFLSLGFNYSFWYMRNTGKAAIAALQNPGFTAALLKFRRNLREMNRAAGVKYEWWQDQLKIDTPLGPMYFPILNTFDPLNGLFGDKFYDSDQRQTPVGTFISDVSQWGPGPHAIIQTGMALDALRRGEREEALKWNNYLGQPTRGLRALTVKMRQDGFNESAFSEATGLNIPAGGLGIEWYMYDDGFYQGRFTGSPWDQRRIFKALMELAEDPESGVTPEQAYDAGYYGEGEVWDRALDLSAQRTADQVLVSWLFGAGLRGRPESELRIAEMDTDWRQYFLDYEDMTPEQRRLRAEELRTEYPYSDLVVMGRRDDLGRLQVMSWSVINRLPPSSTEVRRAFGYGEEFDDLFFQYFDTQLDGWTNNDGSLNADGLRWQAFVEDMSAILALPSDTTKEEWSEAIARRTALTRYLEENFPPETHAAEDVYYDLPLEERPDYLAEHPDLEMMWTAKDERITADPLLFKYYGSMDLIERVLREERTAEKIRRWPTWESEMETYRSIAEQDRVAASDYFANSEVLIAGAEFDTEFDLLYRERLEGYLDGIDNLDALLPALREDLDDDVLRERVRSVSEMFEDHALGSWELPDDLNDRELLAAINAETNSIPSGEWGTVYRSLDRMGNLDRVLDSVFEFRNVETIARNRKEAQILLAALEEIRLQAGWTLDPTTEDEVLRIVGALGEARLPEVQLVKGGYTRRRRGGGGGYRGGRGGGGRGGRNKPEEVVEQRAAVGQELADIRAANPTWYGYIVSLAGMSKAQRKAFLAAHPEFVQALIDYNINLRAAFAYLLEPNPAVRAGGGGRSTTGVNVKFSNPLL